MNSFKQLAASALIALSLSACGGGGSSATNGSTNPTTDTVISGMASKGPINGTVSVYALKTDGSKGSLLTSSPITSGSYSANIGKYAGPVIIEATGTYTDEATGTLNTLGAPLRAALSNASGTISVAVTPLTELAVQKAGTLTASAIDANNKLISDIFKIDIINTQPVAPTSDALSKAAVTQSQKDYTLALAAISQLSDTLASVTNGITSSGMTTLSATKFNNALTAFMVNTNNKTGITNLSSSNLTAVGTSTATYKLAITGPTDMATNAIKGMQFEVIIPAGLTIRYDTSGSVSQDPKIGETLSGIVTLSTLVTAVQPYFYPVFSTTSSVLTFGLTTTSGIGAGDLATIICDVLPGRTVPLASAFTIRNIKAVDANVATISGVNVTVK